MKANTVQSYREVSHDYTRAYDMKLIPTMGGWVRKQRELQIKNPNANRVTVKN
jgi:hypothetical protein